jgi:orotidine-5'-phosphate decarboxylase
MTRSQLVAEIFKKKTFLCVGLDVDVEKIPAHLLKNEHPIFEFNKAIIDATQEYCVAYKPNTAFYEQYGVEGWKAFEETVTYIKTNYPNHFIIADAKRGDIGNTSHAYAKAFFKNIDCDAVTVAPFMGCDSVQPFLEYENKWAIVLALTSNKGANDFQNKKTENDNFLFEEVLKTTAKWGTDENLMFVVGATQAKMLEKIREIVPTHFLLVPGVGAQGGSLQEVVNYGFTKDCGLLVNSSRGIIYASNQNDFAAAAAMEAKKIADEMASFFN